VGHALLVLAQLQGTLDFERGGSAAKQFEQFYNMVRAKLLEAQMRGSLELIQQQIRVMSEVRACWVQAKRIMQPPTGHDTMSPAAHRNGGSEGEWNA
jgi:flagellin-specific chaperone FliS